jgi:hypothetical protein
LTPYGVAPVERHIYQSSTGGKTVVPLDLQARIFGHATPGLTKMVNWKYAKMSAGSVVTDLSQNHGVKLSRLFVQQCNHRLGDLVCEHEMEWKYDLPDFAEPIEIISVSRDGTTTPIIHEGYRETMVGTISFHNSEGERLHTIYTGVAPESGKQSFNKVFTAEIEKVKSFYSSATWVGVADGAKDNWSYLKNYTEVQTIDFYHATEYLAAYSKEAIRGKKKRKEWLKNACHELKHTQGAAEVLVTELKQYVTKHELIDRKKNPATKAFTYFTNNSSKMKYAEWRKKNLPIGSGVVEAGCKTLVKQRFGNSGCRWERNTVDDLLSIRSLILTPGRYEQLWKNIDQLPNGYIK